jgi:PAS domain S-box-containing protein
LNEIKRWLVHLKQHREKQLEIEKSEKLYRTVFETTGTCMCILDADGVIVLVNNFWTEKLGYTKEEIEGKFHFSRVIHKDDLNRVQDYFQARFISPQVIPDEYEARIIDRFGNARNVIVYVRMLPVLLTVPYQSWILSQKLQMKK